MTVYTELTTQKACDYIHNLRNSDSDKSTKSLKNFGSNVAATMSTVNQRTITTKTQKMFSRSSDATAGNTTESSIKTEFDGTSVLCRVCQDKASGFHYGVHSCEGCKGFFRRSIQQKIQYRPCTKNQQCNIARINRNRCQYCRLKKCIAVGMSRDAVRFGRVPKREKARILAAMQQSSNCRSMEKAISAELDDDQRLLATIIRAHVDTCDFTREKVEPMLIKAREQPNYTACPPTLACPLNPNPQPLTGQQELLQDFSKRFSPAIRGVVEFAKRIPGFSLLAQDDQVTLLKAGVFEVLLVRLACMFDAKTSSMICLNGQVLKRDAVNTSNARFLMDSMFEFAERINNLCLSDAEIGLFCSIVIIAPDRPGLRNTDLIEKIHMKLKTSLQLVVSQNHERHQHAHIVEEIFKKIPDLRTLNTLHSEKLLAFKMTEQQQQHHQNQLQTFDHHQKLHTPEFFWTNAYSPADTNNDFTASYLSSAEIHMEEVKSPLGSVSSTESMCSNEINSINELYAHTNSTSVQCHTSNLRTSPVIHTNHTPLLAATLSGSRVCPHRKRASSGSTCSSVDDEIAGTTSHLLHNGLTITPVIVTRPPTCYAVPTTNVRKLDSPNDSGIESLNASPSPPQRHIVDDMPVLKRVLEAPPLYDTNSLMDEAYKPHKKFRALRNAKDNAEAESVVASLPSLMSTNSSQTIASIPTSSSLSSTHSTLAKSLNEKPLLTAEQLKRTDIIHNFIMRSDEPASSNKSTVPSVITSAIRNLNHHPCNIPPHLSHTHQSQQQFCVHSTSPSHSPRLSTSTAGNITLDLMTNVPAATLGQPLNLSKKSPSPSPISSARPLTKVVMLEV